MKETQKVSRLEQMRFCLCEARLVTRLVNLHFVSLLSLSPISSLSSPRTPVSRHEDLQPQETRGVFQTMASLFFFWLMTLAFILGCSCCVFGTESPCHAGEAEWEDALCETLEKEVEDTRKMVSALQVHSDWHSVKSDLISTLNQSKSWCSSVFKALLLHGSLPEDEQDVALCLDQGEADQQVVMLNSLFFSQHLTSVSCVSVVATPPHRLPVFSVDQVPGF